MYEPITLEVRDLSYEYPAAPSPIVQDVSFDFRAGNVSVISGPSGSGKSTILDLIGGLRVPGSGSIHQVGRLVDRSAGSDEWRARFSWILQANTLLGSRTVLDNVALGLLATGSAMQDARRAAAIALGEFGLSDLESRVAGSLSGGEAQRITVLRSKISSRPYLIADEPTGQLDAESTRLVARHLASAAESGKVVIVASHDEYLWEMADARLELRKS